MNKNLLNLFFITVLSFPALGNGGSDDSKFIKLLPKGKIREYCEKRPEGADSRFLAHVIWSAVNEKRYNTSMTKAQQLSYRSINRFLLHERATDTDVIYDWKKNDYKFLTTLVREITLKMKLSVEQTDEEMTKVFGTFIKLEEEAKRK